MTPWGFGLPLPYPKISPGLRGNVSSTTGLHGIHLFISVLWCRGGILLNGLSWNRVGLDWCCMAMIDEKRWNHDTSSIGRKTLAGMPKASVVSSKQSWKKGSDWCDLDVKGLNPEADSYKTVTSTKFGIITLEDLNPLCNLCDSFGSQKMRTGPERPRLQLMQMCCYEPFVFLEVITFEEVEGACCICEHVRDMQRIIYMDVPCTSGIWLKKH